MGSLPRKCSNKRTNLGLPYNVKPYWADFSDAGPGVGVSKFEVQFCDAEMARKSDLGTIVI